MRRSFITVQARKALTGVRLNSWLIWGIISCEKSMVLSRVLRGGFGKKRKKSFLFSLLSFSLIILSFISIVIIIIITLLLSSHHYHNHYHHIAIIPIILIIIFLLPLSSSLLLFVAIIAILIDVITIIRLGIICHWYFCSASPQIMSYCNCHAQSSVFSTCTAHHTGRVSST